MNDPFDSERFLERMQSGEFDGRIVDEMAKLTTAQLEQVAALLAIQLKEVNATPPRPDPAMKPRGARTFARNPGNLADAWLVPGNATDDRYG
jgi:hypothetical protein